jgi:hypothetical protein
MSQTNNKFKIETTLDPYKEIKKQKEPGVYTFINPDTKKVKVLTKTKERSIVEQNHRTEIKKMVADAESRGLLRASVKFEGQMDDFPDYDFQEAQYMMAKAQSMFETLPSGIREKFEGNPAKFMDFVNDPNNAQEMVDLGLRKGLDFKDHAGNPTGVSEVKNDDGTVSTTKVNEPPATP